MTKRGYISPRRRLAIMERDGWRCRYCHDQGIPLHLDHVTPLAKGGTDTPDNLVAACIPCNSIKGVSTWDAPPINPTAELIPRRKRIEQTRQVLAELSQVRQEARTVYNRATAALKEAVILSANQKPETLIAADAQVDRMTVRKWLGKGSASPQQQPRQE